jgi:hypothetical protein
MAIQKLYDASETLFSIHADADFFTILIPHDSKDNWWDIEVVIEGVDDFHLFSRGPNDIFPPVSAKATKKSTKVTPR